MGDCAAADAALRAAAALQAATAQLRALADAALTAPPVGEPVLTELVLSTQNLSTTLGCPAEKRTHRELIAVLDKLGLPLGSPIVAVNCNYGGLAQPQYEELVKRGGKQQAKPPMGRVTRRHEGIGGCINSALELVLSPNPESADPVEAEIGRAVAAKEQLNYHGVRRIYRCNFFPTTGFIQVSGSVLKGGRDAVWVIRTWVAYVNEVGLLGGPVTFEPALVPDMVNFKFRLRRASERQVCNLTMLEVFLRKLGADPAEAARLPFAVNPASIVRADSGGKSTFTFHVPGSKKSPRVNIWLSGKINLLGLPDAEAGGKIYASLSRLFAERWREFVAVRPLTDRQLEGFAVDDDEVKALLQQALRRAALPPAFTPTDDQRATAAYLGLVADEDGADEGGAADGLAALLAVDGGAEAFFGL